MRIPGILPIPFMLPVHLSCCPYYSAFALQTLFAFSASLLTGAPAVKAVDFQREIRPIFAENCFQCHGPDSTTRMAGLRLDLKDAAFETRKEDGQSYPVNPTRVSFTSALLVPTRLG